MNDTERLELDIRDLAAALESVIAAALIAQREPETALNLLRAAQAMAAAVRTGDYESREPAPQA
jgi:hypothetical protein